MLIPFLKKLLNYACAPAGRMKVVRGKHTNRGPQIAQYPPLHIKMRDCFSSDSRFIKSRCPHDKDSYLRCVVCKVVIHDRLNRNGISVILLNYLIYQSDICSNKKQK